jgi:hypothetical protein
VIALVGREGETVIEGLEPAAKLWTSKVTVATKRIAVAIAISSSLLTSRRRDLYGIERRSILLIYHRIDEYYVM